VPFKHLGLQAECLETCRLNAWRPAGCRPEDLRSSEDLNDMHPFWLFDKDSRLAIK